MHCTGQLQERTRQAVDLKVTFVTVIAVEKAINIAYCVCVCVTLVIRHAMRMHRIVICGLPGCAIFSHIS